MRDSASEPDPSGPRKDLHGQRRRPLTLAELKLLVEMVERHRKGQDGEAGESVPTDPHRPNTLSGGAAEPLDSD